MPDYFDNVPNVPWAMYTSEVIVLIKSMYIRIPINNYVLYTWRYCFDTDQPMFLVPLVWVAGTTLSVSRGNGSSPTFFFFLLLIIVVLPLSTQLSLLFTKELFWPGRSWNLVLASPLIAGMYNETNKQSKTNQTSLKKRYKQTSQGPRREEGADVQAENHISGVRQACQGSKPQSRDSLWITHHHSKHHYATQTTLYYSQTILHSLWTPHHIL